MVASLDGLLLFLIYLPFGEINIIVIVNQAISSVP